MSENETFGQYLTDTEGRSLYIFLEDGLGVVEPVGETVPGSTCYDQCAENWPPLITELWPLPEESIGEGVDASLINTIQRDSDATQADDDEGDAEALLQLTYNGWPLYYFANDQNPGDVNGQGVGDNWYLISPEGEPVGLEDMDNSGENDSQEGNNDNEEDDGESEEEGEGN